MNAVIDSQEKPQENQARISDIPLDQISTDPANPRKFFDPVSIEQLAKSIQVQGLIQPIVLRPNSEGGYYIIAGERRFRASQKIGLKTIESIIKDSTSTEEALELAGHENTHRDQMSYAEEAQYARKVLSNCDGDKQEACRRLAFSAKKLDARLLLLHATDSVLTALTERKIKLAHAELLSSLPHKTQNGTLEKVLNEGISVDDLKRRIDQFAFSLEAAIFDKAECTTCPSNSAQQRELFSTSISEGKCSDRACYQRKTEVALSERRTEYASDYPVVWLDIEKEKNEFTPLYEQDVGRSQARVCRSCGDYGALLSTEPGKIGEVTAGLCFNLQCHQYKHTDYKQALESLGEQSDVNTEKNDGESQTTAPSNAVGKTNPVKKPKPSTNSTPPAVKRAAYSQVRDTASRLSGTSAHMILALDLDALLSASGASIPEYMKEDFKDLGSGGEARLAKLFLMSDSDLERLREGVLMERVRSNGTSGIAPEFAPHYAATVMSLLEQTMGGKVVFSKSYVEAFTKSGLENELSKSGFSEWYETHKGEGSFKKLLKAKKTVIVDAVVEAVSEGFTIDSTYLPEPIQNLEAAANKRSGH